MFHRTLTAGILCLALTGAALAQTDGARVPSPGSPNAVVPTPQPGGRAAGTSDVSSGSRSGGASTGTGVGSESTATGGPVGGNTSRN